MFRCRHLFYALVLWPCLSPRLWADASLPDLLLKARDNNPDILAARHGWKVNLDEVSPARTWPDPTFTYIDERFPSGVDGVDPLHIRHYRIEQTIPFPGKLSNEAQMKYHEALIAESKYRATTLEVFRDVQSRYYQLYLTDQLIALAQESVSVLKQTLGSAQARLAAGQSSTSDVFMVQTELHRMENMLFEQQQQKTLIVIEFNTLLNQPADTPLGTAQPPPLQDIQASLAELDQLSSMNNPLYLAAMHEVNHSRAMLTHHNLQFLPDFGFMYERETADAGPDGRQIGVSITFPLWVQRPWGLAQSAKEHITEAEASSQAMRNEVQKRVHTEFTETNTYLTQTRNYVAGILPEAQSALKITRQQYASGQIDFLRFLEAFRTWIQTNNEYQEKLYRYGEHASELERWVGVPINKAKEALEQRDVMPMEMNHEK
jgi:cobalt-zinc-cadmium efflux system outer membrane protein